MKTFSLLFFAFCFLTLSLATAQESPSVTLSDDYPKAGAKLTVFYSTSDSLFLEHDTIVARVYSLDGQKYPVVETLLKKSPGGKFSGIIEIPDSAKALLIKLKTADQLDDNQGNGYVFLIYNNERPVMGAYGEIAKAHINQKTEDNQEGPDLTENFAVAVKDYEKEFSLYPQSDDVNKLTYYYALTGLSGPSRGLINLQAKDVIAKKIASLGPAVREQDVLVEAQLLRLIREPRKADTVEMDGAKKFTHGNLRKIALTNLYLRDSSQVRRDSVFKEYLKEFPAKDERSDFLAVQLAAVALSKGNFERYNKYKQQMKDTGYLAHFVNFTAREWAERGKYLSQAEGLALSAAECSKRRLDNAEAENYMTLLEVKKRLQCGYDRYCSVYNFVLFKEGRLSDALKLEAPIYQRNLEDGEILRDYALMLMADGNYTGAKKVAEDGRDDQWAFLEDIFKDCYQKLHGNSVGYQQYRDSLKRASTIATRKRWIESCTVNKPAPLFTILNLDDKPVALSDYKGKTVVLAFWTSWQTVSSQYMRAMNRVVGDFKNQTDVVFLFINTWSSANMTKDIRDTLKANNYDLTVLLDKTPQNKYTTVANAYKAANGQSVFVVDRRGNIRIEDLIYSSDYAPDEYAADVSKVIASVTSDGRKP
jgi:peroxiredoxin